MKITFTPEVALKLETTTTRTKGLEFSGFGFLEVKGEELLVYDIVILDVGNGGYTEIETKLLLELSARPDYDRCKLWFHRHPVGNGVPGPHNWSGTDNNTIKSYPLGGVPEMVKWSASAVRTPRGWVGRIDNHLKGTTVHVEVDLGLPAGFFEQVDALIAKQNEREAAHQAAWEKAQADRQKEGQAGQTARPFLQRPGFRRVSGSLTEDWEEEGPSIEDWLEAWGCDLEGAFQLIDDQVVDLEEVPQAILVAYLKAVHDNGITLRDLDNLRYETLLADEGETGVAEGKALDRRWRYKDAGLYEEDFDLDTEEYNRAFQRNPDDIVDLSDIIDDTTYGPSRQGRFDL